MNLNIPEPLLTAAALEQAEVAIADQRNNIDNPEDPDAPALDEYHAELRRLRVEVESHGSNIQRLADYERAAALLQKHSYDTEHLQQEIAYLRSST